MSDTATDILSQNASAESKRRMNEEYDPVNDSSKGHERYRGPGDEGKVILIADKNESYDGSRLPLNTNKNGKITARFAIGKDARYKGILVRAALNDAPIVRIDEGARTEASAMDRAKEMGWTDYVGSHVEALREKRKTQEENAAKRAADKAERDAKVKAAQEARAEKRAQEAAERKAAQEAKRLEKALAKANSVGATRTVKIGSVEFTGKVTSVDEDNHKVVVTYTNSKDEEQTRTVPFLEAKDLEVDAPTS